MEIEMELAIYEDCLLLIDKFVENNSPTFIAFCSQWKLMMFQHIYAAQTSVVEVIQTTKTILHLAKRIVCAKDELGKLEFKFNQNRQFLRRIGGMYLLYAIYFKQPTKQYVKVLLSPETWQDMVAFIETLPPANVTTDEVRYIFWHLYRADAFRFTVLDYEVGLEDLVDYDRLYDIHKGNKKAVEVIRVNLKQKLLYISEAEKELPEMITLEDNYNKSKQSLIRSAKSIKEAPLPDTNIFHSIEAAMKAIHDILDDRKIQIENTPTDEQNYDDKRKDLKRKAAGRTDNTENDEETPQNSRKYYGRLTVRQMITQELPENITDDLKNSSAEEDENMEVQESDENESESDESKLASTAQDKI